MAIGTKKKNIISNNLNVYGDIDFYGELYKDGSLYNATGGITWATPIDASIVPDTTRAYDIGSTANTFDKLYLANGIHGNIVDLPWLDPTQPTKILVFGESLDSITYGKYAGTSMGSEAPFNTLIGSHSGFLMTIGRHNTFLGDHSGYSVVTGGNNVFIGHEAGQFADGSNNVFIGGYAGTNETGSDKLIIANNGESSGLIYGDFSTGRVDIDKSLYVGGDILPGGTPNQHRTSLNEIGSINHQYAAVHTNNILMQPDRHAFRNQVGMFLYDTDPESEAVKAGFIGAMYNDEDDIQGIQRLVFGTDGYGAAQVVAFPHGGVSFFHIKDDEENPKLNIVDDGIETHGITYIGDKDTVGSWRYRIDVDEDYLVYEKRESDGWEIKERISGGTPTGTPT